MREVTLRDAFEHYRNGAKVWVSRPVPCMKERTYYEIMRPTKPRTCSEEWFYELARLDAMGVNFPLNYWTE